MTDRFRLTIAQLNATVGDLTGNAAKARAAWAQAKAAGAAPVPARGFLTLPGGQGELVATLEARLRADARVTIRTGAPTSCSMRLTYCCASLGSSSNLRAHIIYKCRHINNLRFTGSIFNDS